MEQEHTCPVQNHQGKPITMVCSNLECKSKHRLMCLRCLLEEHQDCVRHVLEIETVLKGDLSHNLNWLKHEDIKTAIKLINKYNLTNQIQVLETSEKRVEEEFGKLRDHMNGEITKAKEMVLKNLRERQSNDVQINLKTFTKKMEEFYGFDTLVGIVESIKNNNQNDVETINVVLESFFASLDGKKNGSDTDLENKSKALGKYLKDVIELDTSLFDQAKKNLNIKIFENCLKGSPSWTWNPSYKATGIELGENNMFAKKNAGQGYGVVGTFEMKSGFHRWEVYVASANSDAYWIALGIVDKNVLTSWGNPNGFNYSQTYGFATDGTVYQMQKISNPNGYDNKPYICELDMDKGTFTISCDGSIFVQYGVNANANNQKASLFGLIAQNLCGKTVLPYVYLWTPGDRAMLKVL